MSETKEKDQKMSEKVVLPKFDLPGHGPHPAIRALWIAGGLVVLSSLVLGGAMWRHHSIEAAAEAKVKQEKAAAEAKIAAAAALKAAPKLATATSSSKLPDPGSSSVGASEAGKAKASSTVSKRKHRGSRSKAVAKSSAPAEKVAQKSSRDDGAIDKLLSQLK
jgi:hypothetical protein